MKDSIGNELPKEIFLTGRDRPDQALKALTVNTFILAARVAMSKGHTVIYNQETKTATIDDGRSLSGIWHE